MNIASLRRLGVIALICIAPATAARADETGDRQARAADFATCAAYYFNAVNVRPVTEYEAVYGRGERAFNEAVKLVGRRQVDDLMARTSGQMMKFMASDWKNFASVEKRYSAQCEVLMVSLPAQ